VGAAKLMTQPLNTDALGVERLGRCVLWLRVLCESVLWDEVAESWCTTLGAVCRGDSPNREEGGLPGEAKKAASQYE
jgi:hypothetical protein